MRRPDGTLAPYELRVRAANEAEAVACLALMPDDLFAAEIAATDTGDGPIELLDVDGVSRRWVPAARYTSARHMIDVSTLLGGAGIHTLLPRIVPAGSPLAAPVDRPDRFVVFVAEDQLDAAREIVANDEAPDPDEPRCPRCRSWTVDSAPRTTGRFHWLIGSIFRDKSSLQCCRCGHIDRWEQFLARPADDISMATIVHERKSHV